MDTAGAERDDRTVFQDALQLLGTLDLEQLQELVLQGWSGPAAPRGRPSGSPTSAAP